MEGFGAAQIVLDTLSVLHGFGPLWDGVQTTLGRKLTFLNARAPLQHPAEHGGVCCAPCETLPCGLSVCHFMNINSNSFARVGDYSILSKLIGQPK